MTRRQILQTTASALALSGGAAPATGKTLKNMGSAGPGLNIRIAATKEAGKTWDIIEYCHEMGLGGAHIQLTEKSDTAELARIRAQVNKYDMRLTVGLRTPRSNAELPHYEDMVKGCAEMDGRVVCVHDPFSGRRYEQFKNAAEYHLFFNACKTYVMRADPILRKYKMKLAIENHKAWRSQELADWIKAVGSPYVGVCLDVVNNVSLIETPMQTINTLAPYTIFVSFKDVAADFYEEGILLSEVPLGEGHLDLPALVSRFQKKDPNMLFQLEMITRDPLKVPIFNEAYWKIYDEQSPASAQDLAALVGWIHNHPPKKPLPKITGLDPKQKLALEDDLNQRCIDYARAHLPL